jgi:hypothetical protein
MSKRDKVSKRIIGTVFLSVGGLLKVALSLIAMKYVIEDSATSLSASTSLIIIGGSLLGLDLTGQIFKKKE